MRLFRILALILRRLRLGHPPRADIVIFDREGSDTLISLALKDMNYTVLPVRHEVFFCDFSILWGMLRNWRFLESCKLGQLYKIYLLSCLQCIRPKAVITFIDYDIRFQSISQHYKKADFFAVQNGVKTLPDVTSPVQFSGGWLPNPPQWGSRIVLPNFFCFGHYERDLYNRYGHCVDRFIPVGSLKGEYYKSEISKFDGYLKYDICLVSQWREPIFSGRIHQEIGRGLSTLYKYLAAYQKERNLRFALAMGSVANYEKEYEYFSELFGNSISYIRCDHQNYSTYHAMEAADVVVSLHSAAAYEAFAWKKKVLFANFTGSVGHSCPVHGIFSFVGEDYLAFCNKLDQLLILSQQEYERQVQDAFSYLMVHDAERPTHKEIRRYLLESIQKSKA